MAELKVNPADLVRAAEGYSELAARAAMISPQAAFEVQRIAETHGPMGYPTAVGITAGLANAEGPLMAKVADFTTYSQRFTEHGGLGAARRGRAAPDGGLPQRRAVRAGRRSHVRDPDPPPGTPDHPDRPGHRAVARRRPRRPPSGARQRGAGRAVTTTPDDGGLPPPRPLGTGVEWRCVLRCGATGACRRVWIVSVMFGGKPFRRGPAESQGRGNVMAYCHDGECVDGPQGCQGDSITGAAITTTSSTSSGCSRCWMRSTAVIRRRRRPI
jgi:hypothetical protein